VQLSLRDFSAPVPNGMRKIQILPTELQHHKPDRQKEGEKDEGKLCFCVSPCCNQTPLSYPQMFVNMLKSRF